MFDLIIENGDTNSLYKILDQVIDLDDDERDELYVKKWSEIFSDFEIKHNFLQEKLQLQKEKLLEKGKYDKADNIIEEINSNSATKGYSEKLTSII